MKKLLIIALSISLFCTNAVAQLALTGAGSFGGGTAVAVASQNFLTTSTIPAWLDSSATTGARTVFDSTGKLTWSPNNQYINSGVANSTARTITTVAGINYYIWIQTSSGTSTIVASGTNTTTFNGSAGGTFTAFTATAGTLTLTPTTAFANITQVVVAQITYESALRSGDNVVTGASAYFGPRFNYPNGVLAGILIEESRTNTVLNSQNLSGWSTIAVTLASGATGVDGTSSAYTLTPSAVSTGHMSVEASNAVSRSTPFVMSAFVKPNGYTQFAIRESATTGAAAVFTLTGAGSVFTTVSLGAITVSNAAVQQLSNGFYRVSALFTPSGATSTNLGFLSLDGSYVSGDPFSYSFAGNGTSGAIVTGLMIETGGFATSYIQTGAATVTRVADIIKLSGTALTTISGATGTVLQQINLAGNSAAAQYGIYGSTVSPIYLDSTPAFNATNGTNVLASAVSAVAGTSIRAGLAWDAGPSRAISVNGSAAVTDSNTYGTIGATVYLGSNNGANVLNGHIESLSFYNSKLTGSVFTSKTTTGSAL